LTYLAGRCVWICLGITEATAPSYAELTAKTLSIVRAILGTSSVLAGKAVGAVKCRITVVGSARCTVAVDADRVAQQVAIGSKPAVGTESPLGITFSALAFAADGLRSGWAFVIGIANIGSSKRRKANAVIAAQGSRRAGAVIGSATRCAQSRGSTRVRYINRAGGLAIGAGFFTGIIKGTGVVFGYGEIKLTGFNAELGSGGDGVINTKAVNSRGAISVFNGDLTRGKSGRGLAAFFAIGSTCFTATSVGRETLAVNAANRKNGTIRIALAAFAAKDIRLIAQLNEAFVALKKAAHRVALCNGVVGCNRCAIKPVGCARLNVEVG